MSIKESLKGMGSTLIGIGIFILGGIIVSLFFLGSAWASSKLLPLFSILTLITFGSVIFIFLPLAIPRSTRSFSSISLYISSYIFGATLWMEGLLLTLSIWGLGAVFIGIILGGVGVVPIAMLATLIKGMWRQLIELLLLTIATFACRGGALSLAESLEISIND